MQEETLRLLEWHRLCEHLATFASTKLGESACQALSIPDTLPETLVLLAQTEECLLIDLDFEGISDIRSALQRAEKGGMLSGIELVAIAQTLAGARNLRRTIEAVDKCTTLQRVMAGVRTYPELEQTIHFCIDESGTVMNRASSTLEKIRQDLSATRERILQTLNHIIQNQVQALQESHITQRQDSFVLAVKANFKDRIAGMVKDSSASGSTLYIEPFAIVPLQEKLRQLRRQETVEVEKILQQLSSKVQEVVSDLHKLVEAVQGIDLANAKAQYGRWLQANPPEFQNDYMELRELRHPLLVWQAQRQSGKPVIPIQVLIPQQIRSVIITGPNTGGKTATLKTIGLVSLMAKAGMLIPAQSPAILPYFESVYADIGDEQSLEQNLSTFSGHICRIQRIIEHLTPNCLVLLDEVGAGTDPIEGVAIARALLEYLAEKTRLTITTTHYGELKLLKYENPLFENVSVEFDEETLSPTYRLLWGIPGRSQALTIARRLGLTSAIIDAAHYHLGHRSVEIERIITGLEQEHRTLSERNQQAEILLRDLSKLYQEVETCWQAWRKHQQEWRSHQEREVKKHIHQARREIARIIRNLQRGTGTPAEIQSAETALKTVEVKHLPRELPQPAPVTFIPRVGDRVRIPKLEQIGQVLTPPNPAGELTVKLGALRLTVHVQDIAPP